LWKKIKSNIVQLMRYCGRNIVVTDSPRMTIKYGAYALHVGYKKVQTHTQNMKYLLLFIGKK